MGKVSNEVKGAVAKKTGHKDYLTVLSVISAFAVVALHVNGCFWAFSRERYWATANIIQCLFYFAVPVFFMISGATLIGYRDRYDTKTFFKKRLAKTFIPFIIWSLIGFVYAGIKNNVIFESKPLDVINGIFSAKYNSLYWFFPALFAVYLTMPIISAISAEKREKVFLYAIWAYLIFNSALPLLSSVFKVPYNQNIKLSIDGYVVYAIAGYYFDNHTPSKKTRILLYIAGIAGILVHAIGTYVLSMEAGGIVRTYKSYVSPMTFATSIALFVFVKQVMSDGNIKVRNCLKKVSNLFSPTTFGIYLVHFYVIDLSTHMLDIDTRSIVWRTIGTVAVFVVSSLIVWAIQKIPFIGKKVIPK